MLITKNIIKEIKKQKTFGFIKNFPLDFLKLNQYTFIKKACYYDPAPFFAPKKVLLFLLKNHSIFPRNIMEMNLLNVYRIIYIKQKLKSVCIKNRYNTEKHWKCTIC